MTRHYKNKLGEERSWLRIKLQHALAHEMGRVPQHNHLNIDGFMLALERFIDAKIEEVLCPSTTILK